MFYSQSFLTRKGPMGTVWCAAHLQHKLRKSHYISTNIPSTVEKIIDPVMPMALRISGHLLLGVVRIFSKQVDYFQEDCNVVLTTLNRIYTTATVNLPDDANRAPLHSITLPEKFNLDSIEIDDYLKEGYEDSHIKSHEDITFTEQVPTGRDPYIAIIFDEHEIRSSYFTENVPETRDFPREKNVLSPPRDDTVTGFENLSLPREDTAPAFEDPSQLNRDANGRESSPQTRSSIEIIREAENGYFNSSPILPDRAEPDSDLAEQFMKEREASNTPSRDEMKLPEANFSPPHKHQDKNLSSHLKSLEFSEQGSPQLELQQTPTPAIAEPKIRKRRRNQLFDNPTVLSNKQMNRALNDTSGLFRSRRNCPSSSLDIWRQNKRLKKDNAVYEPSVTGSCADLKEIYNEDFISAKHLVTNTTSNTPQPELDRQDDDMDISQPDLNRQEAEMDIPQPDLSRQDDMDTEVLRNNEQDSSNIPFSEAMPSPSIRSRITPEKSDSHVQFGTNERSETQHDTTVGPSARSFDFDSEMESPNTNGEGNNSVLSDIPELENSAEDLVFLEQDEYSSAGFQETAETGLGSKNQETTGLHHSLSSRTRAVAKYLKGRFSCTPISCNTDKPLSGDLNLNKIMKGKSIKKCARIFHETLVLKHNDIIDVEQEEPYSDVILKATPKLSKGDF